MHVCMRLCMHAPMHVCLCVYCISTKQSAPTLQVINRSSELLDASTEQKRSQEAALEQKQRQVTKLETAFKSASQEVMKVCDF